MPQVLGLLEEYSLTLEDYDTILTLLKFKVSQKLLLKWNIGEFLKVFFVLKFYRDSLT